LYLLSADGRLDSAVALDNDTAVQDVAWSPDGKFFVALGGISPSVATLFDPKGKALYKLGSGPYNQICWNPQSRFILLAGFGNMPGDIRLYEKKADNACKPMGGCRSACSVQVSWSPCGRYFLTASVAPRMRVDNRVTVYTYYGTELVTKPYDDLREACWRPRHVVQFQMT
jgi:translation initiation factor 2A